MKTVDHITCPACGGRIREFEPDIALRKLDGSELRFFHTEPSCEEAAQRVISEDEPETWSFTHRHLFWDGSCGVGC
jgi:hypothetical protein